MEFEDRHLIIAAIYSTIVFLATNWLIVWFMAGLVEGTAIASYIKANL